MSALKRIPLTMSASTKTPETKILFPIEKFSFPSTVVISRIFLEKVYLVNRHRFDTKLPLFSDGFLGVFRKLGYRNMSPAKMTSFL